MGPRGIGFAVTNPATCRHALKLAGLDEPRASGGILPRECPLADERHDLGIATSVAEHSTPRGETALVEDLEGAEPGSEIVRRLLRVEGQPGGSLGTSVVVALFGSANRDHRALGPSSEVPDEPASWLGFSNAVSSPMLPAVGTPEPPG